DEQIEQAITIMNQRINSLGVAEPDIHREGGTIVVQIAGLKDEDKDKAIALAGQTAELRFRPALQNLPPEAPQPEVAPGTQPAESTTTTAAAATTTTAPPGTTETGMGVLGGAEGESAAGAQATTTTTVSETTTTAPEATTTTAAPAGPKTACGTPSSLTVTDPSRTTTPDEDNKPE